MRVGLSTDGRWVVAREDRLIPLDGSHVWAAAPVLELVPEAILRRMSESHALAPASPFPLTELLHRAFVGGSPYWAERGAQWYPFLADDDRRKLGSALGELADARWAGQKLRQFARREVRRLTPEEARLAPAMARAQVQSLSPLLGGHRAKDQNPDETALDAQTEANHPERG
jgi:hypothetical protein